MKGRERIKLVVLVALVALVAAAGYGRLQQRGASASPGRDAVVTAPAPAAPAATAAAPAAAPPPDAPPSVVRPPAQPRAALRDLFASPVPPSPPPAASTPAPPPTPPAPAPAAVAAPPAPPPAPPSLRLGGTITGNGRPLAIINGRFVRDGATIDGLVVVSISADRVTLAGDGRLFSLTQIGGVVELVP